MSFTERPVCRYLLTCLQLTAPAKLEPAVPSDKSATPINSATRLMRGPPCGCAQTVCANDAASGNPLALYQRSDSKESYGARALRPGILPGIGRAGHSGGAQRTRNHAVVG